MTVRAVYRLDERQKKLVERACHRGGNDDPEYICHLVERGILLALTTDDSVLLLADYGDSLHISHYGGKLADIPTLFRHGMIVARELKKDSVTLNGRKGWRRYMKRFGFEPCDDDTMRRDISWAT